MNKTQEQRLVQIIIDSRNEPMVKTFVDIKKLIGEICQNAKEATPQTPRVLSVKK